MNYRNQKQGGDWDGDDENMDSQNSGMDDTNESSGEKGGRAQTDIGNNFDDEDLAQGSRQRSGRQT